MINKKAVSTLEEIRAKFENWRTKRKRRCSIPKHLWDAAISLLPFYPVTPIVRKLRLNTEQFRKRRITFEIEILELQD